jgi:cell cycle checkpoint protein
VESSAAPELSQTSAASKNGNDVGATSIKQAPGKAKRKRRVTFHQNSAEATTSTSTPSSSSSLWVEKYAPSKASDLCIAPKKVNEVRSWINAAIARTTPCKLLILVGSPGTGKSTMVEQLAQEMNLAVREWSESYSTGAYGPRGILSVDQQSPITQFEEFLKQSGVGYQSLIMSGISTARKRKTPDDESNDQNSNTSKGSIILLDELPNLHGTDAEARFRDIISAHITQSGVPTVLVFSNVLEGRHKPEDLERLVGHGLLYSPAVQIMQIHAATKPKMKKILDSIAKQEGIKLPPDSFERMHARSGGDLRYAITTLQYEQTGQTSATETSEKDCENSTRDTKLSTFHALGKLLYAKRLAPGSEKPCSPGLEKWNDGRPPLDFDPERVVEFSDIELGGTLSFLGYHSVEFFTDITELSSAFDRFSDAAMFVDRPRGDRHSETIFPDAYAGSLAGRAVGNANKHPTASKFRQFNAPKVFEVFRNRRANEGHIGQLKMRLSSGLGELLLDSVLSPTSNFTTDYLPFVRTILPNNVRSSLDKMHSNFRSMHAQEDEEEAKAKLQEQEEVLRLDDIGDYDSDDMAHVPPKSATANKEVLLPSISPTSAVGGTAAHDDVIVIDD